MKIFSYNEGLQAFRRSPHHHTYTMALQGRSVQKTQDAAIAKAVSESKVIHIRNNSKTLLSCLAFRVPPNSDLGRIRSQLGNSLAAEAERQGLAPVGMVAYMEVNYSGMLLVLASSLSYGVFYKLVLSCDKSRAHSWTTTQLGSSSCADSCEKDCNQALCIVLHGMFTTTNV